MCMSSLAILAVSPMHDCSQWACSLQTVAEMGKEAINSMRSVPAVLRYLAVVVIQDALEDAPEMRENPVHAYLLENPLFQ